MCFTRTWQRQAWSSSDGWMVCWPNSNMVFKMWGELLCPSVATVGKLSGGFFRIWIWVLGAGGSLAQAGSSLPVSSCIIHPNGWNRPIRDRPWPVFPWFIIKFVLCFDLKSPPFNIDEAGVRRITTGDIWWQMGWAHLNNKVRLSTLPVSQEGGRPRTRSQT